MLTLPRQVSQALRFTPEQFAALCEANPQSVLELTADGQLIEITPTGGETGRRNNRLACQLERWARNARDWCVQEAPVRLQGITTFEGGPLLPELQLDLSELWEI